jgi:hypothetical protein
VTASRSESIGVIFSISESSDPREGVVKVLDAVTNQPLLVYPISVLLTLSKEGARATTSRGRLEILDTRKDHPVQSNGALFTALRRYVQRARGRAPRRGRSEA